MLMPISLNGCAQAASHRASAITRAHKQPYAKQYTASDELELVGGNC
jgi:hypothetical protein